ncbi:hypothetical protein PRIPAC_79389 [Pristionchus pacificus]|uniref:G protein-coupled receptor n=1 Tax=Pristionchus pacificus TaxID=54126 RepID=A0A2A6CQC6_PRIPA|nr:hypothetical protein PRIPAC_79389 [Pristionchus pacificus]|eukprot:PDM80415.1 G protein-coupled receptor [Pristionchus pacificus]
MCDNNSVHASQYDPFAFTFGFIVLVQVSTCGTGFNNCPKIHVRTRILLAKGTIGRFKLQCILLILFSPHIINIFCYLVMLSPKNELVVIFGIVYGNNNAVSYGLYGFGDITEIAPVLLFGYLVACPTILTVYVIFARQKLILILHEKIRLMSIKSSGIHASVIKVLTTHTALILVIYALLGGLAAAQIVFHVHSPDVEHAFYDVAIIPALANPVITLCFVRSYKTFVLY